MTTGRNWMPEGETLEHLSKSIEKEAKKAINFTEYNSKFPTYDDRRRVSCLNNFN